MSIPPYYSPPAVTPVALKKLEVMGKFSLFLDKLAASFKHDADPATLTEARTNLEAALLDFINAKVHADYHVECYCLLNEELSGMAAYYRTLADHQIASNPTAASLPNHEI